MLHWVQTEENLQGSFDRYLVGTFFSFSFYQNNTEVPAELTGFLDKDTFTKARLYALDKYGHTNE